MSIVLKIGLCLMVLSPLIGVAGTLFHIYGSFAALETAEVMGVDAVGYHIRYALIFSSAGVLGSFLGIVLVIVGRTKDR